MNKKDGKKLLEGLESHKMDDSDSISYLGQNFIELINNLSVIVPALINFFILLSGSSKIFLISTSLLDICSLTNVLR